jgi:hypothetical protein
VDDSPSPDEEAELLPFPSCFGQEEFTGAVTLRLVPKDDPNPALLEELAAAFTEAAVQAGNVTPTEPLDPVPDDQGVQLRAILDQKAEEIREKATKAEPRAAELKQRIEQQGRTRTLHEVAAARERLIQTVIELKQQFGIVITARPDGGL